MTEPSDREHQGTTPPCEAPLAEVRDVSKSFARRGLRRQPGAVFFAVDEVSLRVPQRRTVAVIGESGSGKTTLGRLMLRLIEPTSGTALFQGTDLASLAQEELRRLRRKMQIVFQNPYASLNPRFTVEETIAEGPEAHGLARGREREELVLRLLDRVGLRASLRRRLPGELSGGERQRVAIARALSVEPEFLVLDEVTAALDPSVQARILNLLDELQEDLGLGYLFIAHNLDVVRHMADEVAVLSAGKLVEFGPADEVLNSPGHPHTLELLRATPPPDPRALFAWHAARRVAAR